MWKACVVKSCMTNFPLLDKKLSGADASNGLNENIMGHLFESETFFFYYRRDKAHSSWIVQQFLSKLDK